MTSVVRSRNVKVVTIISDKHTIFKPFRQDFYPRIHKIEEKKVVTNSENQKVVFSLFETVKFSVLISQRILYNSWKSKKERYVICPLKGTLANTGPYADF